MSTVSPGATFQMWRSYVWVDTDLKDGRTIAYHDEVALGMIVARTFIYSSAADDVYLCICACRDGRASLGYVFYVDMA